MVFIFSIAIVFIAIMVYLFFRAEKLQQKLMKSQSESRNARKESQALLESLMLIIAKQDESIKQRLHQIKALEEKNDKQSSSLAIINPLLINFALIARECLKGKGQLSIIVKKCYENSEPGSYKAFTLWIKTQDTKIKRMWSANTLSGYLSLVEALLVLQSQSSVVENKKSESQPTIAKAS